MQPLEQKQLTNLAHGILMQSSTALRIKFRQPWKGEWRHTAELNALESVCIDPAPAAKMHECIIDQLTKHESP